MSEIAQAALVLASEANSDVKHLHRELDRVRDAMSKLEKTVYRMEGASVVDEVAAIRKAQEEVARQHTKEIAALETRIDVLNSRNQKKSLRRM